MSMTCASGKLSMMIRRVRRWDPVRARSMIVSLHFMGGIVARGRAGSNRQAATVTANGLRGGHFNELKAAASVSEQWVAAERGAELRIDHQQADGARECN